MTEAAKKLLAILQERSFMRGSFQLASGDKSNFYLDGKMSEVCPEGAYLIGEVIYEQTKDVPFDAIGGLEVGAVPLTTAAVISYYHRNKNIEGFWVRDEIKKHGTQKLIEGKLERGARVVLVDDVVTRGESIKKAYKAVKDFDCTVVLALTLVDRLVGSANEFFEEHGIEYRPIFTIKDFGINVDAAPRPVAAVS